LVGSTPKYEIVILQSAEVIINLYGAKEGAKGRKKRKRGKTNDAYYLACFSC
jgi:hypothetical protein